jgi:hypothetical protein
MARIKELWRKGEITWSPHAEERLAARKLDITDVENIIRFGHVSESSKPGQEWRYKVEGPTVEQQRAGIVCEFHGDLLVLVSVMLRGYRGER